MTKSTERQVMSDMKVYDTPENIALFRLETTIKYAEGRAQGIHLVDPRKARSVQLKALRAILGIRASTWASASAELRTLLEKWRKEGVPEDQLAK